MPLERFTPEDSILLMLTGITREEYAFLAHILTLGGSVILLDSLESLDDEATALPAENRTLFRELLTPLFTPRKNSAIILASIAGWSMVLFCNQLEEPLHHDADTFHKARCAYRDWRGESG